MVFVFLLKPRVHQDHIPEVVAAVDSQVVQNDGVPLQQYLDVDLLVKDQVVLHYLVHDENVPDALYALSFFGPLKSVVE